MNQPPVVPQNHEPLLSVVIPVFNGKDYVGKLMESLYSHNAAMWSRMEIVIVDDGSTDGSFATCEALAREYAGVSVFRKQNGGIASARNYGLERTSGEFITFCDQDDEVIRGYHDYIVLMRDNRCDILIADTAYKTADGVHRQCRITRDEVCGKDKIEAICRYFLGGRSMPSNTTLDQPLRMPNTVWNEIFSSRLVRENNITFKAVVDYEDDWRFTTTCMLNAHRVYLSCKPYYVWWENPASESHTRKYIANFLTKINSIKDWAKKSLIERGCGSECVNHVELLFEKRALVWGFYNACALPREECVAETKSIMRSLGSRWRLLRYADGESEFLYLMLLLLRLYRLAYILNTRYIKRVYH